MEKKYPRIFKISIWAMFALFIVSAAAQNPETTVPFDVFFTEHGKLITMVVCAIWVVGGLIGFKDGQIGGNALCFACFWMVLSAMNRLYNFKTELATPDDIAEFAASIVLIATALLNITKKAKDN